MRPLQICIIPANPGFVHAARITALQQYLQQRIANRRNLGSEKGSLRPVWLTYEPAPIFTIARPPKQADQEPSEELTSDLRISSLRSDFAAKSEGHKPEVEEFSCKPDIVFRKNQRLARYDGPGQIAFSPLLDLKDDKFSRLAPGLSTGQLLTSATLRALNGLYGKQGLPKAFEGSGTGSSICVESGVSREPRQIADITTRERDDMLTLTASVNLEVPISGPEDINPWARLTAAGIEFKKPTSVVAELRKAGHLLEETDAEGVTGQVLGSLTSVGLGPAMKTLGTAFAEELELEEPEIVGPEDIFGSSWVQLGQKPGEEQRGTSFLGDALSLAAFDSLLGIFD